MTFTPNIPAVGQSLGSSQSQVLNNFASLRSTLAANHVDVNSANPGTHTHADFIAQGSNPNPLTGFVALYSKVVSGVTELFLQRENSGAVIQMSVGTPTVGTNGSTFLPGGVVLKWGTFTLNSGVNTQTISFSGTFPHACFAVVVSAMTGNVNDFAGSLTFTTANFVAKRPSSPADTTNYSYIAIGN